MNPEASRHVEPGASLGRLVVNRGVRDAHLFPTTHCTGSRTRSHDV